MEEINQNQQIPQPSSPSESGQQKGVLDHLKGNWQNRRFRLVFIGLVLLFFAGFIGGKIWWLNIEKQAYRSLLPTKSPQFLTQPTSLPLGDIKDKENTYYFNLALDKKDPEACRKITVWDKKSECLGKLGVVLNDLGLCKEAGVGGGNCYVELAQKRKDIKICQNVVEITLSGEIPVGVEADQEYWCYFEVGSFLNDLHVCSELDGEKEKGNCYRGVASFRKNPAICNEIAASGNQKATCYAKMGEQLGDSSLCERAQILSPPTLIVGDWCLKTLAVNKKDLKLCEQIKLEKLEAACYGDLGIKLNNLTLCRKALPIEGGEMEWGSFAGTNCYIKIAQNTKNPTICEELQDSPDVKRKAWCYSETGATLNDLSLCKKAAALDLSYGDSCYRGIAITLKNSALCETVYSTLSKASCYRAIAEETTDPSLCDKTKSLDFYEGETCYYHAALWKKDAKFCELIEERRWKAQCYGSLGQDVLKDSSLCEKAQEIESDVGDACYTNMAAYLGERAICQKIIDEQMRNGCHYYVK